MQKGKDMHNTDIDAVITWVDGNDPKLASKRLQYQKGAGQLAPAAIAPTRFDSQGEIYLCIASLLKFAPFLRKIFIVTDNQTPKHLNSFIDARLCESDRIIVVDHKEIFRDHEYALPTFNSRSIESMLWRIPNLSETFISLNDDFFLNRPTVPEDFFVDGKPVLRGRWHPSTHNSFSKRRKRFLKALGLRKAPLKANFHDVQSHAAAVAGSPHRYFRYEHTPRPVRKSVLGEFFTTHPGTLKQQILPRFRSHQQFQAISLSYHLELLQHNTTHLGDISLAYFHPAETTVPDWIEQQGNPETLFACVQSLDETPPHDSETIRKIMVTKLADTLPDILRDHLLGP